MSFCRFRHAAAHIFFVLFFFIKMMRCMSYMHRYVQLYLTTKETWHILCVIFLEVNEYDAHLSFQCVKLNKGKLRCTEII